jgi:hypothetical protein
MLPIVGDIAMNRIFYPDEEVTAAYNQLPELIAPNGHPEVNGENVSAFHPLAVNVHNYGAFVGSVVKRGKRVIAELCIDELTANQSEHGVETMRRVRAGEKIGVSTSLLFNQLEEKSGVDRFGEEYDHEARGYLFDHVATLLKDAPAGGHAGTYTINTKDGEEIPVGQLAVNLTTDELHDQLRVAIRAASAASPKVYTWVMDVILDEPSVVYSVEVGGQAQILKQGFTVDEVGLVTLQGSPVEVVRRVSYVETDQRTANNSQEVNEVDKKAFLTLFFALNSERFTPQDQAEILAIESEADLAKRLSQPVTKGEAFNALSGHGVDLSGYDDFVTNREQFKDFMESKQTERKEMEAKVLAANSKLTAEDVAGFSDHQLEVMHDALAARGSAVNVGDPMPLDALAANSGNGVVVDFTPGGAQ